MMSRHPDSGTGMDMDMDMVTVLIKRNKSRKTYLRDYSIDLLIFPPRFTGYGVSNANDNRSLG